MPGVEHLFDTPHDVELVGTSAAATLSRNAANSARFHAGADVRRSAAASAQSSSRAASDPSGFVLSANRARGSSARSTAFTGDDVAGAVAGGYRDPWRRPAPPPSRTPVCRRAPATVSAGKPRTVTSRDATFDGARELGQVLGPAAQAAAFQPVGDRLGNGRARRGGKLFLERVEILATPQTRPSADSTTNVTRRCAGSLSRSNASIGTRTPVRRSNARCSPSSRGSRSGSSSPSTARAVSGAGTKLRRRAFGNDRMSSVTNSSRNAGTCQANSSPPSLASTSTGRAP